jgi:hypothetical protein
MHFIQVALPIMLTIVVAAWMNSRGLDRLRKAMEKGFGRIEATLEVRTSPLARRG